MPRADDSSTPLLHLNQTRPSSPEGTELQQTSSMPAGAEASTYAEGQEEETHSDDEKGPRGGFAQSISTVRKKEGFDVGVFLPQLILRLCPPLMLFLLIPASRPRVDHLVLSIGIFMAVIGKYGTHMSAWWVATAAIIFVMATPAAMNQICKRAGCPRLHSSLFGGYGKINTMKTIFWMLGAGGLAKWSVDLHNEVTNDDAVCNANELGSADYMLVYVLGCVAVLAYVVVHLWWLVDSACCGCCGCFADQEILSLQSRWKKPRLLTLFTEEFRLGTFMICENQIKRLSGNGFQGAESWDSSLYVPVTMENFAELQPSRVEMLHIILHELCGEDADEHGSAGRLVPQTVLTIENNGYEWEQRYRLYDPRRHADLEISIAYIRETASLKISRDHRTGSGISTSHQGFQDGACASGYCVSGVVEGNEYTAANGDYGLVRGSRTNRMNTRRRSVHGDSTRAPLHFSNKSYTLYVHNDPIKWMLGKPKEVDFRQTFSSSASLFRPETGDITEIVLCAAESSGDHDKAFAQGPPRDIKDWDVVALDSDKVSDPSSGEGERNSTSSTSTEIEPRFQNLRVAGYQTVEYSMVFPRRIDMNFQRWLGAIVDTNEHVEMQIILVELFVWSMIQAYALLFVVLVFSMNSLGNDQLTPTVDGFYASVVQAIDLVPAPGLSAAFVSQTVLQESCKGTGSNEPDCRDAWSNWTATGRGQPLQTDDQGYGWCPDSCQYSPRQPMRLASSEVVVPVMMFCFVAFISASEHATLSGADTISSSREDRWYRRAIRNIRVEHDPYGARTGEYSFAKGKQLSIQERLRINRVYFIACLTFLIFGGIFLVVSLSTDLQADEHPNDCGPCILCVQFFAGKEKPGVCLFVAGIILGLVALDSWQRCVDGLYRIFLVAFLAIFSLFSNRNIDIKSDDEDVNVDEQQKGACSALRQRVAAHNLAWFSDVLDGTDQDLTNRTRGDERDERRRQELSQTYIQGSMWETWEEDSFKHHFRDVNDPVKEKDIPELQALMKVYRGSQFADAVHVFPEIAHVKMSSKSDWSHRLNDEFSCTSAGNIVEMILHLSKARRLVKIKIKVLTIIGASVLHATAPVWHAWLPSMLGGTCGMYKPNSLSNPEELPLYWGEDRDNPNSVGKWLACSETWWQFAVHCICAAVGFFQSFAILSRLLRCQTDYYARYCHMLYFIQLTPWSNLNSAHRKRHWGLLPTFDLSCPQNIEAWNKIRLYLQSAQIKTSRYLQISVLWCFVGVLAMSVNKIVHMVLIEARREQAAPTANCLHSEQEECQQTPWCEWDSSVNTSNESDVAHTNGQCVRVSCLDISKVTFPTNATIQCNSKTGMCVWDTATLSCLGVAQHFDTMSLFVLVETLIVGVGLLFTLWEGMLSNEIKREAFPHVIRMKHSELLSNAMNFVTERAQWERHKRNWRKEELMLLSIANKLQDLADAYSRLHDDVAQKSSAAAYIGDSTRKTINQLNRSLTDQEDELKAEEDELAGKGVQAFANSRPNLRSLVARHVNNLITQLKHLRLDEVGLDEEELKLWVNDLVQEGCADLSMLQEQIEVAQGWTAREDSVLQKQVSKTTEDYKKYLSGQMREDEKKEIKYLREGSNDGLCVDWVELAKREDFGRRHGKSLEKRHKYLEWNEEHKDHRKAPYPYGEDVTSHRTRQDGSKARTPSAKGLVQVKNQIHRMTAGGRCAPEPEPEPQVESPPHLDLQVENDRQRCIEMLKVLSTTLDRDYQDGVRAHWGYEDRRTKMVFITLDRSLLYKAIGVMVTQLFTAVVTGLLKFLSANSAEADS